MAKKTKLAKNRLDKYYKLAKEQGYRSRAAFKLVQLNKKYDFLGKAKSLVDLCAAPGGWLQVAAKHMPPQSVIIGVDLAPIKPIPRCITLVGDITTEATRTMIKSELKTWDADVVLHDGAPNVGTDWRHDAFMQNELTLYALKLATSILAKRGTFVTKVFRSRDYNNLMWVLNQLFERVEATKPVSSRSVSAEIFVVCRDYKRPDHIDPKLLDPRAIFKELDGAAETKKKGIEALTQPEKSQDISASKIAATVAAAALKNLGRVDKKNREGYVEGDSLLARNVSAQSFIESANVGIAATMIATYAAITFSSENEAIKKSEHTSEEILECCKDLRVLGRKECKLLLRWRKDIRIELGIDSNSSGVTEEKKKPKNAGSDDDEENIMEEVEIAKKAELQRLKKLKKKFREIQAKAKLRMQNVASVDFIDDDIDTAIDNIERIRNENEAQEDSFSDQEAVDQSVNNMSSAAARFFSDPLFVEAADATVNAEKASDSQNNKKRKANKLNEDDNDYLDDFNEELEKEFLKSKKFRKGTGTIDVTDKDMINGACAIGMMGNKANNHTDDSPTIEKKVRFSDNQDIDNQSDVESTQGNNEIGQPLGLELAMKQGITTAHGLVLAQRLLKNRERVIDSSFNKYSLGEDEDLPEWFAQAERTYWRPQLPLTKEAVEEMRRRKQALDARPIKKIAEAKARKMKKARTKTAKIMSKAAAIVDDENDKAGGDMTESSKAKAVQKLLSKRIKANMKPKRKVVVARGPNKGLSSRPSGVKGKYKMVDARLKKDVKAAKRLEKKIKGGSKGRKGRSKGKKGRR